MQGCVISLFKTAESSFMKKIKCLFVEPDMAFHTLNKNIIYLEKLPVEACFINDSITAWQYLRDVAVDQFPDVIIIELKLPFTGGLEFAGRVDKKFKDDYPHLKIFLTTNAPFDISKISKMSLPFTSGLLGKPFSSNECYSKLFNA